MAHAHAHALHDMLIAAARAGNYALFQQLGKRAGCGSSRVQGKEEGAALVGHAQPWRRRFGQLYEHLEERHLSIQCTA